MTNFDFLKKDPQFVNFADVAIAAEKIINIDIGACVINCRRAMEFAVKWMYSVDDALKLPYQDALYSLMNTEEFRDIVDEDLFRRMDFIRLTGNSAAHVSHTGKKITRDAAKLCLENLHYFMDFIACCYGTTYEEVVFNAALIDEPKGQSEPALKKEIFSEVDLKALIAENQALREELTARREEQHKTYVPKPLEHSEYDTRKLYIDAMLVDVGWIEGENWLNEVKLSGIPTKSGTGYADYVLYDDAHRPLAIIEAKSTCKDVVSGRQQAKVYADAIEKQCGRRPVVFLSNGFDTRIDDGQYPERKVSGIWSKRDLERWFNLRSMRTSLQTVSVDRAIAGRYYQEAAIKAVCDSFGGKNRRKALLVMATGSGKTRTVIGLVKVLLTHMWVKNVLFLADRNSLVTQAKRSFVNLMKNELSVTNLCEEKENYSAACVFATYQTMMNCIDNAKNEEGKIFTCGHFDLIICDEAHRSIYNKYRDIFNYFDALLVGLTATPKDEVDRNTYNVFELENGVPTYGYELSQAVADGYLVDFLSVESSLKFIEEGIVYSGLSEEERAVYEDTFGQEDGRIPESINSSALNEWVFNEDTIRKALNILMTKGIRINYGEIIGKTIIFAKNHDHAEKIREVFEKEYPNLPGYARVIDNYMAYAQSAIDEFSAPEKLPQIAISVDMLDTGIDVPEVLNLVFFKKVMSKAKFWQMIGRGTRLSPGLLDGKDKDKFYIFDFCRNFEFFRMNAGKPTASMLAVQGAVFNLEFQISYKLQAQEYQVKRLRLYREELVGHMCGKVRELNRENFAVRQHLKYVEKYSDANNYNGITYEDTLLVRKELAPLIDSDSDEASAVRFDALMYGIELASLAGKKYGHGKSDLLKKVCAIAKVANIPEIMAQTELIGQILHSEYLDNAGIDEFEHIRKSLRSLMKYIPRQKLRYDTDFEDDILSVEWRESELENDDLKNYKAKAEYYVRQNQDHVVIAKLKNNEPLTSMDVEVLEEILWSELGTKEEYEAEYGNKPLGEFVREIVGLDMNAAKEAFAEYSEEAGLDSRQMYFVNQIVEYIVHNGILKDFSVLQEPPFTDHGSMAQIFTDLNVWMGIKRVIENINGNALAA